jgi:hypothetical protein
MSLTTEEPVYLSPDMYTPYEVDVDDVLVHWAQDKMPLSGRTFGHEKELILKPEANPRVIRASDFAEAKSRIIAWIDSQGNPMTLYRAVRIPSADAIDLGNLGVFWTPNRLKADSPHGKEVRGEDVVIEILARRSDVDEFGTVATMRRYPGEEEIRLQADSSVTVVSLHTLGSNVSVRRTGRT